MKTLIITISLLLSSPCLAQGIYVGGGAGGSNLNYNLHQWLENKESQYLTDHGLGFSTVPFSYQQKFAARAYKVFVGYEFNKWFQTELTYKNYGTYTANVTIDSHINQTVGTAPTTATVNASALGTASASASASSVGLSMLATPIHGDIGNVFMRIGVEYARAEWTSDGNYNYQYNYSVTNGSNTVTGNAGALGALLPGQNGTHGPVPVIGMGIDYKIMKHLSLRTEVERTGNPRSGGVSIDMYTMSMLYRF